MIPVIRTYLLYLQTVVITAGTGATIIIECKYLQYVHRKSHILSRKTKYLEI